MKRVRTARGKYIDMAGLAKMHEDVRAVSNIPMNARGDRLDGRGNVKATVQSVARAQHAAAVSPEMVPVSNPQPRVLAEPVKSTEDFDGALVVSETTRTRPDGSRYIEIEYSDGSFSEKNIEG